MAHNTFLLRVRDLTPLLLSSENVKSWFRFIIQAAFIYLNRCIYRDGSHAVFLCVQHSQGDVSRSVWLQAAESAYRFSLGSIAGGKMLHHELD